MSKFLGVAAGFRGTQTAMRNMTLQFGSGRNSAVSKVLREIHLIEAGYG